jgi:hypothetical protein
VSPRRRLVMDHVSWSQMSKPCPVQLKGQREHWAKGPTGIALLYGRAGHAGIEYHLTTQEGSEAAVEIALSVFAEELGEAEQGSGVRWDDPPRLTQAGQPYRGDEGRIPDLDVAYAGLTLQVGSWVEQFGSLRALAPDGGLPLERPITVPLDAYGFPAWELEARLDVLTDEGGVVDLKFAKEWKPDEIDDKLDQGHLYHLAYEAAFGHPAEYLTFHNGIKGTAEWRPLTVEYCPAEIRRVLEHLVAPTIRMIEANAYTPNRSTPFPHSEKWCEFWHSCPFGAAASRDGRAA